MWHAITAKNELSLREKRTILWDGYDIISRNLTCYLDLFDKDVV